MSNKKRIAIFSVTYDPFIGGAEVAIKEVAKRLPDFSAKGGPAFGWDLFAARLDSKLPSQEKIGNVNVYRVGTGRPFLDKLFYPWRTSRLALKMHAQNPYAVVHAVLATYAGLAALLFKKRATSVPYILTLQSGDSDWFIRLRTWFWYPWYRQIYTKADKITAISNWLADRARRYGYKKDIEIIPNGVDIDKFSAKGRPLHFGGQAASGWDEKWKNDFVIITASRLVYKNGIDTLIDAMRYLPSDVRLVIAGEGKEEKKLKSQVTSCKLQDRVRFLGHIDHNKLPGLLKSSDVFARPSRTEGFGNSFIEAMSVGLPVIATSVGGIVDFIKDKETGLLTEVNNSKSVADAVMLLKNDSNLREKISKSGQLLAQEKYDWKIISNQYKNIYQKLTQKHVSKN